MSSPPLALSYRRTLNAKGDLVIDHVTLKTRTGAMDLSLRRFIEDKVIESSGLGSMTALDRDAGEAFLRELAADQGVTLAPAASPPGELRRFVFPFTLLNQGKDEEGRAWLEFKFEWRLGGQSADGYLLINPEAQTAELTPREGEDLFWRVLTFALRDGLVDREPQKSVITEPLSEMDWRSTWSAIHRAPTLLAFDNEDQELLEWSDLDDTPFIRFELDGRLLSVGVDCQHNRLALSVYGEEKEAASVQIADQQSGEVELLVESTDEFSFFSSRPLWSVDGRLLALSGSNADHQAITRVYDTRTRELVRGTDPAGGWEPVRWVEDEVLVSNGKTIARWSPATGALRLDDSPVAHRSPGGRYSVTALGDTLQIRDERGETRLFSPLHETDKRAVRSLKHFAPIWLSESHLLLSSDRLLAFDAHTLTLRPLFDRAQLEVVTLLVDTNQLVLSDESAPANVYYASLAKLSE